MEATGRGSYLLSETSLSKRSGTRYTDFGTYWRFLEKLIPTNCFIKQFYKEESLMSYATIFEDKQNLIIFREFLNEQIQSKAMTTQSLANRIGIDERTLRNYIHGRMPSKIQLLTYRDILSALGTDHEGFKDYIDLHNSKSHTQQNTQVQDNNKSSNSTHIAGDVKNNIGTIKGNVTFN